MAKTHIFSTKGPQPFAQIMTTRSRDQKEVLFIGKVHVYGPVDVVVDHVLYYRSQSQYVDSHTLVSHCLSHSLTSVHSSSLTSIDELISYFKPFLRA